MNTSNFLIDALFPLCEYFFTTNRGLVSNFLSTCFAIAQFTFLEVGTGTGGALRRIHPLIARALDSYTASDVSVINLDDDFR